MLHLRQGAVASMRRVVDRTAIAIQPFACLGTARHMVLEADDGLNIVPTL